MTKEQYINPECEKFTLSGVDYYVHPEFTPIGISMDAKLINIKTLHVPKIYGHNQININKYIGGKRTNKGITLRRMLALAFVPAVEGCSVPGRKFAEDESFSIENTAWRTSYKEEVHITLLKTTDTNEIVKVFESNKEAYRFVWSNAEYNFVKRHLLHKTDMVSKCGKFVLVSA